MDINENSIANCGECGMEGPLHFVQQHFLEHFTDPIDSSSVSQSTCSGESSTHTSTDNKDEYERLWASSNVLLLIRLVENRYELFDTNMKKTVWVKIATGLTNMTGKTFTPEQVDNKWKGLKRIYKNIKDHNSKTGRNRKTWEFYGAIDGFLNERPGYTAPATCSSKTGLKVNDTAQQANKKELAEEGICTVNKKRKRSENAVETRHKQKMERFDKFLALYQMSVEHQVGKKIVDSD